MSANHCAKLDFSFLPFSVVLGFAVDFSLQKSLLCGLRVCCDLTAYLEGFVM